MFLLLAAIVLLGGVLEIAATTGFPRASKLQRAVTEGHDQALQLRPRDTKGRPTLLVVGNSLAMAGVRIDQLQRRLDSRFGVTGYMIAGTASLDWYYAIRRTLSEGSRPDAILICVGSSHLFQTAVADEYFARFMLQTKDWPDLARRLDLHPTRATNLLAANLSGWFGAKSDIRKFVLQRTLPHIDKLAAVFGRPVRAELPEDALLRRAVEERFAMLRKACDEFGVRLIVAIPPTGSAAESVEIDRAAAQAAGVTLLLPMLTKDTPGSYYEPDGYHLNPAGGAKFTDLLADRLQGNRLQGY